MDAVWIVLFVRATFACDRLFQRKVEKYLPHIGDCLTDPSAYLSRREMTIGPKKQYAVALITGGVAGLMCPCFVAFAFMGQPNGAAEYRMLTWAMLFVCPLVGYLIALRMSVGARLVLRREGALFHYRGRVVYCPWSAIDPERQAIQTGPEYWMLPIHGHAFRWIVLHDGITVSGIGPDFMTKHVSFRRDGDIKLYD